MKTNRKVSSVTKGGIMVDRNLDILKQGFMKQGRKKSKRPRKDAPIVSCDKCMDWHRKGKHTKPR